MTLQDKNLKLLFFIQILIRIKIIYGDALQTLTCASGSYYFPQQGSCNQCYSGCDTCSSNEEKDCLTCTSSLQTIQLTNQILCSQCVYSQYYGSSICSDCSFDCELCYDSNTCLKCKVGYVYNDTIQKCDLTNCEFGYYRDAPTNTCIQCPISSLSRSCYQNPSDVNTSFLIYWKNPKCIVSKIYEIFLWFNFIYNFKKYIEQPTKIIITSCIDGFLLFSGDCICVRGTYMDTSGSLPTCTKCTDPHCEQCKSVNTCYYCKNDYYYYDKTCAATYPTDYYYYLGNFNIKEIQASTHPSGKQTVLATGSQNYCSLFLSYFSTNQGCFLQCPPYYFSLYQPSTNSFLCVQTCPQSYTLNLQTAACIANSCTGDISQNLYSCYYMTCPVNQYFPSYQSANQISQCQPNSMTNCLSQSDQYVCTLCSPGYVLLTTTVSSVTQTTCVIECPSGYYIDKNQCNACGSSTCTPTFCQYTFDGSTQCIVNCPDGYYLQGTLCKNCPQNNQISCSSSSEIFQCEWGQNTSTSNCVLTTTLTVDQYLDQNGIPQSSSGICSSYNTGTSYCNTCNTYNSEYMFNINGVCTIGFFRPTKYVLMPDPSEFNVQQYKVQTSCPSGYFVQQIVINNQSYAVCKQFATCTYDSSLSKCTSCSTGFYLLNGNCTDDCPNYTYKNSNTNACESPITNCATYKSSGGLCKYCFLGYLTSFDNTSCILSPNCAVTSGYFIYQDEYQCRKCPQNCDICDSDSTCQKPSSNYYLQGYNSVTQCDKGYYPDTTTQICTKCMDMCDQCTDSKTCTQAYPNIQVSLIGVLPYINDQKYCPSGQYYDTSLSSCTACSSPCSTCFQQKNQCLTCIDSSQVIINFQCLAQCPSGQYAVDYSISSTVTQKFCNTCNPSCAECQTNSTFCTKCNSGMYLYQNTCVSNCPQNYYINGSTCYLQCSQGQFNTSATACSSCSVGCIQCTDASTCQQCDSIHFLQDVACVSECSGQYKINPQSPNTCFPCNVSNCNYCSIGTKTVCEQCSSGYQIQSGNCIKIQTDPSESGNGSTPTDDNSDITYTGKIYEGDDCHFTCLKCKGNRVDECLKCKIAYKVFYNKQYCMCPDGTYENGEDQCAEQTGSSLAISILDMGSSWLVLLTLALNRTPIFSLLLIDMLSLGSYQIYFDQLYNYLDKFSTLEVLNQSNFSSLIPNVLQNMNLKDIGIYLKKSIITIDGDQSIQDSLTFAKLSSFYFINSFSYIVLMGMGILVFIALKLFKPLYLNQVLSQCLIMLYYFTFQDQLLFMGLQFKTLQFNSSSYSIISFLMLCFNLIFNGVVLLKILNLYKQSNEQKIQLTKLYQFSTILSGLILKSLNALNILVIPKDIQSFIFVGIIGLKIIIEIYNVSSLSSSENYTFIYKLIRYFILFEGITFFLPALLNSGYPVNKILDDRGLHSFQKIIALILIIEKICICLVECLFSIIKNDKYLSYLNQEPQSISSTSDQSSVLQYNFTEFNIKDIEIILNKKNLPFSKKIKSEQ